MKKIFCLFACLCSFALSAMGDIRFPLVIVVQQYQSANDCVIPNQSANDCVIPSPRAKTPENDDAEVAGYSGEFSFGFDRCCWVQSPKRTDKDDEKDCLGRCPISPVEPEKK